MGTLLFVIPKQCKRLIFFSDRIQCICRNQVNGQMAFLRPRECERERNRLSEVLKIDLHVIDSIRHRGGSLSAKDASHAAEVWIEILNTALCKQSCKGAEYLRVSCRVIHCLSLTHTESLLLSGTSNQPCCLAEACQDLLLSLLALLLLLLVLLLLLLLPLLFFFLLYHVHCSHARQSTAVPHSTIQKVSCLLQDRHAMQAFLSCFYP